MISLFVKLMSGDMLSVEVSPSVTHQQFYQRTFAELPTDLGVTMEYQLTLLRAEGEIPSDDTPLEPSEEETFYAMIDTTLYSIDMYALPLDIYESGRIHAFRQNRTAQESFLFEAVEYTITCNTTAFYVDGRAYYIHYERTWFHDNGIPYQYVGRFRDEMMIDIPQETPSYSSAMAMGEKIMGDLPITQRAKDHLVRTWAHLAEYYLPTLMIHDPMTDESEFPEEE